MLTLGEGTEVPANSREERGVEVVGSRIKMLATELRGICKDLVAMGEIPAHNEREDRDQHIG